ncbi:hypothetical protein T07_1933 [Trichinella nelsoni]|uniref:Retrovirus-related Pol polyprotein from transposon n=1 Tax=Trichinella nelsoni TaxID=6336 RepID=A0A0V0RVG3_9BILA|nr:hypothetical protein T07_1933 [Trichinella nelsoni]
MYDFEVIHRPGQKHRNADAVSWRTWLTMRSSREQSHDKMSSGPAGPDNRQLKDPMEDTGHWREKIAATYSPELTAVEARLNGVKFAEPQTRMARYIRKILKRSY